MKESVIINNLTKEYKIFRSNKDRLKDVFYQSINHKDF